MVVGVLLPVLVGLASALGSFSNVCITEPPLRLVAGESIIQATNHDPTLTECQVAIFFANPAFEPITFLYNSGSCWSGAENASFTLFLGVPNGDAFITWSCKLYTQACIRAVISRGCGDLNLPAMVNGKVECQSF